MTPHIILVAGSGKPIKTQERRVKARELWDGKLFRLRWRYAEGRSQVAGIRWAILSPLFGVLLPDLATPPHPLHQPPDHYDDAFDMWQKALRNGLAQLIDRAPELQDVEELRIEVHAPYTWCKMLSRALPEHRLSFPLGVLNGRAAWPWYMKRAMLP